LSWPVSTHEEQELAQSPAGGILHSNSLPKSPGASPLHPEAALQVLPTRSVPEGLAVPVSYGPSMDEGVGAPRSLRVVMAVIGAMILAAFLLLGAVLWANSGDGRCDGPTVPAGCHRE
jgi:hypothetical protein